MADNNTWKVQPHGKIQRVSENILRVEAQLTSGPPLVRVMTVLRLAGGDLLIHNAIALNEESMKELEAFGTLKYLIVPNGWHRMDAGRYFTRYPQLKVFCPRGSRAKVAEVVPVHGVYEEFPDNANVRFETLQGINEMEGAVIFEDAEGATLVMNDVLFNMPHLPGIKGFILKYLTGSSGGPRVSRLMRLSAVKDKAALRAHFEKLANLPRLKRIVTGHYQMIENNPAEVLRNVAGTL